ncbi:MAG: glutamate N-acetyltransferase / amino-acid N-acetyltransferase [Thermoleophilaceae bacterium]|nr:glutamate N-acetyltransferase / amino-acid N-acetyltransferase [Thermoleophilaceae bacterium]
MSENGFFSSRWVDAPAHVRELEPTALPQGFRAGAAAAGLREPEGLDVGVLFSDAPDTTSAARFTSNSRLGAPVIVSQRSALDRLRAVVANAGGSNTGDGQRGLDTARATQEEAAEHLGIEPEQVGVASTGVIAAELPREKLLAGTRAAIEALGPDAGGLSEAIVTTDRWPKRACLEVALEGGTVRVAAQAKGAGMISPRYATMFCFVQTDASLEPETIDLLTGVCVKRSFDRISVDGQLSTSDTVFVLASGESGVRVAPESVDELLLGEAIDALMRQLAMSIVSDGEGSKRVGRVIVRGGADEVERVARSVANSPLVKAALHGADPNFGRILQAAGQVLPPPFLVDLEIEGRRVVTAGEGGELRTDDLRSLEEAVSGTEVEYALTIPGEGGETEVFFSDLSHEYVTINAEYTT